MSKAAHSQAMFFQARAGVSVKNKSLQAALQKAKPLFSGKRSKAIAGLADDGLEFEALRLANEEIRNRVLNDLDVWLDIFEERAKASGAEVLWAGDGEEICDLVIDVARRHGVSKVAKSKSMLSEEARLNDALSAAGIQPVETDLGEYIIQLAGEAPSHIIAPAVHKSIAEVEASLPRPMIVHLSHELQPIFRRWPVRRELSCASISCRLTWGFPGPISWLPKPVRRRWSPTKAMAGW